MEKRRNKKIMLCGVVVILLLLLALGLRLNFVLRYPQVPVVWDAAGYHIQAKEFLEAFQAWPVRQLFLKHFKKAYADALYKCELYPIFLSAVYAAGGIDFPNVRVAQALLGTLNCLLLYLIAARVFNRGVALFSLLLAAVYIPFILSEGRLLTETLAIFVLLLANWLLVLSLDKGRWWLIFLTGMVTALLVIARTFFQYIFPVYWLIILLGLAASKVRWFLARSLLFFCGFGLIIFPRLLWTPQVDREHRPLLSGSWRNGLAIYCGIHPHNQGLQSESDPGGEILREVIARNRGRPMDDNYYEAYLLTLLRKPAEAIPVLLAKGWLFWQRAYNDFLQTCLLPPEGINRFNRILLVLGLFGLGALVGIGPRAWPLLFSSLYIGGICFLADAESRYTLPVMPFMIGCGVWFLDRVGRSLTSFRRPGSSHRHPFRWYLGISLFFLGAGFFTRPAFFLLAFPALSFPAAHRIRVLVHALFIFSLIPLCWQLYRPLLPGWRRVVAAGIPPLFILAVYLSALKVHPTWHQWKFRLGEQPRRVKQIIELPPDLENYRSADLKVDMVSGRQRSYDLIIKLEGETVRHFQQGLTPDPGAYITKRRAFPIYLREQKRNFSQVRQWFTVPLDIIHLRGKKTIEVELEFTPRSSSPENYVDLYGDYRFSDDPRLFRGPTFSQSPRELSLYRYLVDDDWRLWREVSLPGPVTSQYFEKGKGGKEDLSPSPGMQSGRYRIFLLLSEKVPATKGFPVAVRGEDMITRKTQLANYYSMQVWEVNPWKRKSNRMLLEAAHAAPGEEGGFWLVVYADTDNDGKPDRELKRSPYLQTARAGAWSSWEFTVEAKRIFVGMTWPPGSNTLVYYERAMWPDDIFPQVMYYRKGPRAAQAYPVITNMRISFIEEEM